MIIYETNMTKLPTGCSGCELTQSCYVLSKLGRNYAFDLLGAKETYDLAKKQRPNNCPFKIVK